MPLVPMRVTPLLLDVPVAGCALIADIDVVAAVADAVPGANPYRDIAAPSAVLREGGKPDGGVEESGAAGERAVPDGGVAASFGVGGERSGPDGGVAVSFGVGGEREGPDGGVVASFGVGGERAVPDGGVVAPRGSRPEHLSRPPS